MARKEYTVSSAIDFIKKNSKNEVSEKDKLITVNETTSRAVSGAMDFLINHHKFRLNAN
jgi:hypothetical protein